MLPSSAPAELPVPDPLRPAILVVDDEPDVLTILHRLLRDLRHDHALVAVSMGAAAVELLALCSVSLLITDYNMPGMNGLQLITTVKRASPHTRTVLLTAYDTREHAAARARQPGRLLSPETISDRAAGADRPGDPALGLASQRRRLLCHRRHDRRAVLGNARVSGRAYASLAAQARTCTNVSIDAA